MTVDLYFSEKKEKRKPKGCRLPCCHSSQSSSESMANIKKISSIPQADEQEIEDEPDDD